MTIDPDVALQADLKRRASLQWLFGMAVSWAVSPELVQAASDDAANAWAVDASNFHGIYDDDGLRTRFRDFLRNVYSIYPSDRFHALITDVCKKQSTDKDIFLACQARLQDITPVANQVRNALPALLTQTEVVGKQILSLLDGRGPIDGYLEMGTKGGYIGYARSDLTLHGDLVLLSEEAPGYALGDVFERRVVGKLGRFVDLNGYAPISSQQIAPGSLDVVCNPIGFHHIPLDRRADFIQSLRQTLRPNGVLLLRDHDASSPVMNQMVALAHDVFNMGLNKSWTYNQREVRHFISLQALMDDLRRFGFKPDSAPLYQAGDPTLNAMTRLMAV